MKFIENNISGTTLEMEIDDDSTLDEVLESFQNFLRACGYVIEYNECLVLEKVVNTSFAELKEHEYE
jgi:hypothetical protein|tara:strand:+ start:270 stop:470 length:201 start_codon:yes stop_codon:yes gene_type:complete